MKKIIATILAIAILACFFTACGESTKNDEKHYLNQKKEIERLEAFIENQRRWNRERNIIAAESLYKSNYKALHPGFQPREYELLPYQGNICRGK